MRKRYKRKLCSCGLCKPHKQGWEQRWKAKELSIIDSAEAEMKATRGRSVRHDRYSLA